VVRGGSWNNNSRNARAANRNNNDPENRNNNLGLRLASMAESRNRWVYAPAGCASVVQDRS
jgi:hypothetical protein